MKHKKLKNSELVRIDEQDYKSASKTPITVVLDDIRSLNNVGSVFRTCDAFRIEQVFLCGITAKPPHKDIQKTALGATKSVPWTHFENSLDALKQLKESGYTICAIEQTQNAIMLDAFDVSPAMPKLAVIFGNEVKGVSQQAIDASDYVLEIPQFGTKHSLNISVSTGVVLWDLFTKLRPNLQNS
ncbi:MAG: RNA methyltransferase [Gilvibacter sp.]